MWTYLLEITSPETHLAKIRYRGRRTKDQNETALYLPSWSPGSYFMREYSRNIRTISASTSIGEALFLEQTTKNCWKIDWEKSELNKADACEYEITYEIYCHQLTVRTSHIDSSHAFLHGPSLFMAEVGTEDAEVLLKVKFPPIWSKLTCSLEDCGEGDQFLYRAKNYDELLDSPIEIGCHETDGFMHQNKEHHLAFYGQDYPHSCNLKKDIQDIVSYVSSQFEGDLPYPSYTFITHFLPQLYGGLEHSNSTVLHFDGRKLAVRKSYLQWLSLVCHEYFHTWNIKRIRPKELGPFRYTEENYTKMLWLAEGLTSFVDDLFVYQSGLSTLEEYLEQLRGNLEQYEKTPGKKFHSLEQSSWNAWIKLYAPDENLNNSSISYYLKGGLVFWALHVELVEKNSDIRSFIKKLWHGHQSRPQQGFDEAEIFAIIEELGNKEISERFQVMVQTTEDIDFESYAKRSGLSFEYERPYVAYLGANFETRGERVFMKSVVLDGPSYQSGLNAGDEMIAINQQRLEPRDLEQLNEFLRPDKHYLFTVSRNGVLVELEVQTGRPPKRLKQIKVTDKVLVEKTFGPMKSSS